ncbi:MAG: polysulfide reductase NrfD [Calditerrivibrio sp.]|nr:polysulfide reductase NrfD [Calditerrivibrio sp.]MCA1933765.1 polysulfide reductase NrfD [Calditerrivibrio sp.]MCA1980976.1 polysulfide reductase NrfD [Calditerrivibrio sp.]
MSHSEHAAPKNGLANLITYNKDIPAYPYIIVGLILLGIGGIGALLALFKGHAAVYNVSREMPWGLLIGTYAYFVITSTGLAFIGGLAHAFGYEKYGKVSKRIVVMAVAILLAGFTQIGLELGNPLRMVWMFITPNFKAPIFWMGIFYSIELVILFVELYLVFMPNKSNHKLSAIVGFFALLVGTIATSNLGYVFGSLNARPFFHGIYFSTFLVISGITAGAAMLIIVHNIVFKGRIPSELNDTISSLAKLMGMGIGIMIFLYFWKIMSSLYTEPQGSYEAVMAMLAGPLKLNFWIGEMLLAVFIPLIIIVTNSKNPAMLKIAGISFMIGLFFTRYDFIVAGQMPVLREPLPGSGVIADSAGLAIYSPSIVEWMVYALGWGVFLTLYFAAEKFLDLNTSEHH